MTAGPRGRAYRAFPARKALLLAILLQAGCVSVWLNPRKSAARDGRAPRVSGPVARLRAK